MNGWVKLHRKMLENIFLMHDNTAWVVFSKLLLMANSKGQIGKSGRELADELEMPYSTTYKTLKRLEGEALISQSGKHSYTLILICKWDKYQETGKQYGKQMGSAGEAHGKRLTGVARIENKELRREVNIGEEKDNRASRETVERVKYELKEKGVIS